MQLSAFGYAVFVVLIAAPIAALASIISLARRRRVTLFDIGALLLPPLAFIFIGMFRPPIHIGWAMFLWPILIAVVVMYLFALRVLFFDRGESKSRTSSVAFFVFCMGAGLVLGATVPPWYD